MVRLLKTAPRLDDVVGLNYADIHWQFEPNSGHMVITSAIDNLLKGAASQAVQCANLATGQATHIGLHQASGDK
jgi:N-acetyl-gamma-glutamyl-phosphate reductase